MRMSRLQFSWTSLRTYFIVSVFNPSAASQPRGPRRPQAEVLPTILQACHISKHLHRGVALESAILHN